jgi:hypothetical protein
MNLTELQDQLDVIFRDPTNAHHYTTWLNESVRELAHQYDLPGLRLKLPATLATTTTDWQYDISTATPPTANYDYMKRVFKITNSAHTRGIRIRRDVGLIDAIDPDHDETGDDVSSVAVEDTVDDAVVAIYPKANDTLNIWWYRQPIDMSVTTDLPDGIPAAFHMDVLLPMAVLKGFRVYPDIATESELDNTRALTWWEQKLKVGLYGDGYRIGMIYSLKKSDPIRQRGPRSGGNLAGGDRLSNIHTRIR